MTKLKINNLFNIKKKICVVSGANGGLGSKIVKGLLLNGAIVIGIDIKTTKNIQSKNFQFIKVDLTKKKETHKLFVFIKKKFKKIDSIINICGVSDPNNFNNNIDVNLIAPFNLINSLQKLLFKKGSTIVNITSLNAELGFSKNPGYNSSKGALKMLTKALANDLAKNNVRVNNIGPGYFLTDMTKKFYKNKKARNVRLSRIPMNRYGKPDELVGSIIYLISNASSYITGQDIYIDGGLLSKGI
ncbi:SDR family oxidoreductase [Candidatus Pelagibacter sp. HIMB123]|uniref:SDR family oxidoreductase n=1 Tax=Candidatus Pelagibacter sp. HIMB123 TaxID=3415413 RepID=UPI003F85ACA1